jgi:cytochrome c553
MRLLDLTKLIICAGFAIVAGFAAGATPVNVPDTMAERVKACVICHGVEDRMGRDGYYPRIAGKPERYLFNQLRNFRDGQRYYRPMAMLLADVSDQYLLEMAAYFSALEQPYATPERLATTPEEVRLARKLIHQGDAARKIPACTECHGKQLMGTAPFIPGLLGLPRAYMTAQFGAWKSGGMIRGKTLDCMSEIAKQLSSEEINALAAWLAAQPVPENAAPALVLPVEMARRCASIIQRDGGQ